MIRIDVVEQCPVTAVGTGVMKVSHNVLMTLAGAVYDTDEWIALLTGTRSANGLEIAVTGLKVPLQTRSYAACELARPEPLGEEVVGVIHSHHSMGAFFSKTDHDTLNPRFASSLVVARVKGTSSLAEQLLGFSYKAEGRAMLPCSNMGVVNFIVIPEPAIPDWPVIASPGYGEPDMKVGLHDCPCVTKTLHQLVDHCVTKCHLETTAPAETIFGCDSEAFLAEVEQKTEKRSGPYHNGWPNNPSQGMVVVDNRNGVPNGFGYDQQGYNKKLSKQQRKQERQMYESYDSDIWLRHWGS